MNKKLLLFFIFSAVTGCLILGFLFLADYLTGPQLTLHNVTVQLNEEVSAWNFVTECSEKNATVRFKETPDFSVPGGQTVEIEAIDKNGKSTVKKTTLKVSIIKSGLKLEADGQPMRLEDLLVDGIDKNQVSFKNKPVTLKHVGLVDVRLIYQGVEYESEVYVMDNVAPEVTLKETIYAYQNHSFEPEECAQSILDATDVTVAYKGMLDLNNVGDYPLTLVFTDEGENVTELVAVVHVTADTTPPVITGAVDREYFLGENISYLDGITAEDEVDGTCEVEVDNQAVREGEEGTYEVRYSALDQSGNRAEQVVHFVLRKMSADEEKLNAKADEVLASITDDTMSLSKKVYAVYNYAYSNIEYTGVSDKSNWQNEAYRGMNELNGDCFTYASVCKILLKRLGVATMDVTRVGGSAQHYWLLVNTGSGWYHFDATRRKEYFDGFMARDEDLAAYTQQVGGNYYTFDTTLYPATPTEKYVVE